MSWDLARASRTAGMCCGAGAAGAAAVGVAAWRIANGPQGLLFSSGVSMNANTALCLAASGLALVLLGDERSRWRRAAGRLVALVVIGIGLGTLIEQLFKFDLGIDRAVFTGQVEAASIGYSDPMGLPAAVAFPMLGLALVLLDWRARSARVAAQILALLAIAIAFVPLLGYIFRVRELYGVAQYTGIALPTAIGLILLGAGVFLVRPTEGAMRVLLADDAAGFLLRRIVPAAILLPIVLGRLRMAGEDAGLYHVEFGASLFVLSMIVTLVWLTWWTGLAVWRQAVARERAEVAEREMHARLMATLESERNARALAERSNRMKDEFLATLSHELRTPLNAILGWVHLLVGGTLNERDTRRGLEAIERNSRLQVRLIEDLLDMSRIESGRVRLDVQDVELAQIVEAALSAAKPAADARQIRLERDVSGAVGRVKGDPARLQQVLWNLLTNAIKFTPPGGRVTVALRRSAKDIDLTVTDTGIGISPDFIDQVFDRFRQADASTTRRHGGLGLGLSIARQLTELHGGTLMAESLGENQGATFTVRLPAAPQPAVEPAILPVPTGETDPIHAPGASLRGVHVLVVDDQPEACELVERLLGERGARVTAAYDVTSATGLLERESYDVLVSDISMPQRDGFDLISHVRAHHGALPAIALTAFARPEDSARVKAAGFDQLISKPFSADRLAAAVADLIRRDLPAVNPQPSTPRF